RSRPDTLSAAEAKRLAKRERVGLAGVRDAWICRRHLRDEAKPTRRLQVRVTHEVRARRIEDSVVAPDGRVDGPKTADSKGSPLATLPARAGTPAVRCGSPEQPGADREHGEREGNLQLRSRHRK